MNQTQLVPWLMGKIQYSIFMCTVHRLNVLMKCKDNFVIFNLLPIYPRCHRLRDNQTKKEYQETSLYYVEQNYKCFYLRLNFYSKSLNWLREIILFKVSIRISQWNSSYFIICFNMAQMEREKMADKISCYCSWTAWTRKLTGVQRHKN